MFQIRQIAVLTVVCMLLWVTSFVETGYLENDEEAKLIYQNLLLISVGGLLIFVPIAVKYLDVWHPGVCISVSFFMRSILLIFGFPFLSAPDTFLTYFVSFWMLAATGF